MRGRLLIRDSTAVNAVTTFPAPSAPDYWNAAIERSLEGYTDEVSGAINNVPSGFSLSNTSAPTVIYTETILGLYLGTSGRIKRTLLGVISTDPTTPGNLTISVGYGAQSITILSSVSLVSGASLEPFSLSIDLAAKNATNAQALYSTFIQSATFPIMGRGSITTDSTVNQSLIVTVTFSVASLNNIFGVEAGG